MKTYYCNDCTHLSFPEELHAQYYKGHEFSHICKKFHQKLQHKGNTPLIQPIFKCQQVNGFIKRIT